MDSKQKEAQRKYRQVTTRTYTFRFNKDKDNDVIERLDKTENRHDYLKMLIRQDESPLKKNAVSVRRLKDTWQAEGYGIDMKEASLDLLIYRIKEQMKQDSITDYCIRISEIKGPNN